MNEVEDPAVSKLAFEEALRELELTVSKLEAGDLTLEEALILFEMGQNWPFIAARSWNRPGCALSN